MTTDKCWSNWCFKIIKIVLVRIIYIGQFCNSGYYKTTWYISHKINVASLLKLIIQTKDPVFHLIVIDSSEAHFCLNGHVNNQNISKNLQRVVATEGLKKVLFVSYLPKWVKTYFQQPRTHIWLKLIWNLSSTLLVFRVKMESLAA